MSIFSKVESGTSWMRSRFHKSISYSIQFDSRFGLLTPVLRKFCLPGDVWRIGGQCLIRLQPMVSPPMNRMLFKVRYFFVPLRLIEPNTELIITGSKDGHFDKYLTLPKFDNVFDDGDTNYDANANSIPKHFLYDYFGCQTGSYVGFATNACLPASYWGKAYARVIWDYYDDENIGQYHQTYSDYSLFEIACRKHGGAQPMEYAAIPKDYFVSSLPWQLKGIAPTITLGVGSIDFTNCIETSSPGPGYNNPNLIAVNLSPADTLEAGTFGSTGITDNSASDDLLRALNKAQVSLSGSLDANDIRTMFAQTRIFERLARTGSRYTEYLRANFGFAPADDTLQRAQYLGGWKLPIVTTEVLQTAADGSTPVGTMRGHGITNGGNKINTFHCKEFGILLGIAHVMPEIKYTTGCPREMSYKSRFDFFNPSFQHLSEQEVRNGELWIGADGKNDDTFGFQAYANELRTSNNIVVGDMRGTLSYWNQSLDYSTRPNLDNAFIDSFSYLANFNKCFAVSGASAWPLVIDFYNDLDVYRPMVRYGTPGLVDHL